MSGVFNFRSLAFVAVLTCSLMVVLSQTEDVESCVPVAQSLSPCLGFIKGSGKPSASCCSGVKQLAGNTKTKKDKVALCECIKKSLAMIGPYDPTRIPLIPKQCGISVQIPPINNSTNCSKYTFFFFFTKLVTDFFFYFSVNCWILRFAFIWSLNYKIRM